MELDKIICGDAYELIKEIPDKFVDCVITDPPYKYDDSAWFTTTGTKCLYGGSDKNGLRYIASEINNDGLRDGIDLGILDEFCRVCKKINVVVFCNKFQIMDYLDYFVKGKKCFFEILIWAKTNPVPLASGSYLHDKEYILAFWEQGAKRNVNCAKNAHTVFLEPINQRDKRFFGHPTIKPLSIVSTLVRTATREGGVILDPFCGSGTTAVACKDNDRHFIAFERSEKWAKVANDRIVGKTKAMNTGEYEQETIL